MAAGSADRPFHAGSHPSMIRRKSKPDDMCKTHDSNRDVVAPNGSRVKVWLMGLQPWVPSAFPGSCIASMHLHNESKRIRFYCRVNKLSCHSLQRALARITRAPDHLNRDSHALGDAFSIHFGLHRRGLDRMCLSNGQEYRPLGETSARRWASDLQKS